eukprot:3087852-Amphidinium_carterae.2
MHVELRTRLTLQVSLALCIATHIALTKCSPACAVMPFLASASARTIMPVLSCSSIIANHAKAMLEQTYNGENNSLSSLADHCHPQLGCCSQG